MCSPSWSDKNNQGILGQDWSALKLFAGIVTIPTQIGQDWAWKFDFQLSFPNWNDHCFNILGLCTLNYSNPRLKTLEIRWFKKKKTPKVFKVCATVQKCQGLFFFYRIALILSKLIFPSVAWFQFNDLWWVSTIKKRSDRVLLQLPHSKLFVRQSSGCLQKNFKKITKQSLF